MALRKRGKSGTYHAYFRTVVSLPDGRLKYASTTVNLYTNDLITARALEAELMAKNKAARMHQRTKARLLQLEVAAGIRQMEELPQPIIRERRKKRLRIAEALNCAEKYKKLGDTTKKIFTAFAKNLKNKAIYMDEITPEMAFEYLCSKCPERSSGKNFNNIKSSLNTVFRLTLLDSGIEYSPFAKIPNRSLASIHQRPFSEEEFVRIYEEAAEPWKTAVLIAWFTGLRQKDVFTLCWNQINGDILTTIPAKTSRFGRAVQIPIHPQLAEALQRLPHCGERVLGAWEYDPQSIAFRRYFGALLRKLEIRDNIHGKVVFNSLRDSFVTRCDAAGIPRHAIRGIVGHVEDNTTDLYSHDLTTARMVQDLPRVKLG